MFFALFISYLVIDRKTCKKSDFFSFTVFLKKADMENGKIYNTKTSLNKDLVFGWPAPLDGQWPYFPKQYEFMIHQIVALDLENVSNFVLFCSCIFRCWEFCMHITESFCLNINILLLITLKFTLPESPSGKIKFIQTTHVS